jgi:hypothetical protein
MTGSTWTVKNFTTAPMEVSLMWYWSLLKLARCNSPRTICRFHLMVIVGTRSFLGCFGPTCDVSGGGTCVSPPSIEKLLAVGMLYLALGSIFRASADFDRLVSIGGANVFCRFPQAEDVTSINSGLPPADIIYMTSTGSVTGGLMLLPGTVIFFFLWLLLQQRVIIFQIFLSKRILYTLYILCIIINNKFQIDQFSNSLLFS